MKVLALDSATRTCSVAVWIDGRVVAAERVELPRGQAEALLPMVERVSQGAGIALTELDRLAVTIGPGHFTGLRVGLAAARGLALALDRPLVGITTLDAVAAAVPDDERRAATLVVALDSKRIEPYLQAFGPQLRPLTPPTAARIADYASELVGRCGEGPYLVAGDAADGIATALATQAAVVRRSAGDPRPDARIVAALAAAAPLPATVPAPLYLHPVEVTTPTKAAFSVRR